MILSPNYDGSARLLMDRDGDDCLMPIVRQHRRFAELLHGLDDQSWETPSRCDGWTARHVVAHLVGVNDFWATSIRAGRAGHPSKFLVGFDPAATPPILVRSMAAVSHRELLQLFTFGSDALLELLADLEQREWSALAESPIGHVSIRLVVHHALWDSWIHERDIALPLGMTVPAEFDEVTMCLRYVAALSPLFGFESGHRVAGRFAVDATDPDVRFVLDIDESVTVLSAASTAGAVCLRGRAVALTEALSLRAPLPPNAPAEWRQLLGGLRATFDDDSQN